MVNLIAGTFVGDYEIESQIGQGGMGVVYRARQGSLDRTVAIKILPAELCLDHEYVDRFLQEARAAAYLNHPHIVQVYDAGVYNDIYFFVMEFVDGKTLGEILREEGRLKEKDVLRFLLQSAKGLAFAHRHGIVHRDVKPDNLMLTSRGILKIGDLGLAKWKPSEYDHTLTAAGTTIGTPYYISPEQIRGLKDINGQADIYSLGMTFYHLLVGRPAFTGNTPTEIMAEHLSKDSPPLSQWVPEISKSTLDLINEMTAKKQTDRILEMEIVVNRVADILGEQPLTTPILGMRISNKDPVDKTSKFLTRATHVVLIIFFGLMLALAFLVAWKFYRHDPKSFSPDPSSDTREISRKGSE